MNKDNKTRKNKKILSGKQMSRKEIIEAVTEPDSVLILGRQSKTIAISTETSTDTDIENVIRDMDVKHGSLMHRVVRLFCEEKKTSAINVKVFIVRIRNLNNEQLKVVGLLCQKSDFTVRNILKAIQSIRKIDGACLLALRAFIDLEGIGPGPLNRFFITTLPQSNREEVGKEAYESEVREKMMNHGQNNVFYNICNQIEGITPSNAITILSKVRNLKSQHTKVINAFLKKDSVFGDKPINSDNIVNLINLWLNLPELDKEKRFKRLIKRISKKSEKQKDFKFIVQSFIKETVNEKSGGTFFSFIHRLFS